MALRLIEAGVETNDLVAIHLEQSLAVVVSQLAILKAGAGFLPFDMKHPPARIRDMLEDARPRVVVMKAGGRSMPEGYESKVIWVDELGTADTPSLPVKTSSARRAPRIRWHIASTHRARRGTKGVWYRIARRSTWRTRWQPHLDATALPGKGLE